MKKIAPFMVLLAGILWGMIGIFVRKLNIYGFGSMEVVTIRAITTTILMFLFLLVYNARLLKVALKDVWCFFGTGILSIVFFNYCYFKAITLTSLSVAAVLLYTAPAIVMVLSVFLFKEKLTLVKIIAVVVTFAGCVLVSGLVGDVKQMNVAGILCGLGAGFGYALYSIFSRYALDKGYHTLTITFYTFLFAMVGTLFLSDKKKIVQVCGSDGKVILFCLVFGLVSTVIPYIVYTRGLQEMENSQASIIASIEPVAATLLGLFAYHERLSLQELIGVVLVIGAIAISNLHGNHHDASINDGGMS